MLVVVTMVKGCGRRKVLVVVTSHGDANGGEKVVVVVNR